MADALPLRPRRSAWHLRLWALAQRVDCHPKALQGVWLAWLLTRAALFVGMLLGARFCDPQFYHYAGEWVAGRWPYRDVPVEYPPLAVLLLLLPALPLLPFSAFAARPDAAFTPPLLHLPAPDPTRYAAYGTAFAVEMLLIDALTLWLVLRAARILGAERPWRAGALYVLGGVASGALLAKFDLAAGTLLLAAVLALVQRRPALGWALLGAATLVKGFPVLVVPVFVAYALAQHGGHGSWRDTARAALPELRRGALAFAATVGGATLLVALTAGLRAILTTVLYHADRGTEIESLFANLELLLGWLPGLAVRTVFSPADLSRVVRSPLDSAMGLASLAVLGLALLLSWAAVALALRRLVAARRAAPPDRAAAAAQLLILGTLSVSLAFLLAFRALPAHYLLVLLPLAPAALLGRPRARTLWLGLLLAFAALGQAVTATWDALVALAPGAVLVLSLRNLAWVAAFGTLCLCLVRWPPAGDAASAGEDSMNAGVETGKAVRESRWARWRRVLSAPPPIPGFTPRGEDAFAHVLGRVSPRVLVLTAGVTSAAIYLGFVLAFPIWYWWDKPHPVSSPNLINDMGRITGYSPVAAVAFALAVVVLFACQFLALIAAGGLRAPGRDAAKDVLARRALLALPVLFALILIWMQPVTTTDLYGYVARGYLQVTQHANPMTTPAFDLPGGLRVNRPPSPYGPLWLAVTAAVSRLAGESLLANLLIFKVLSTVALAVALLLVDGLARQLCPERRLHAVILFGWSPLLLFEAIGNGHNDLVMMLCVLAAFALMLRGYSRTAFTLLVLGALVKYVSAVFVPLWLVYEVRRRMRSHAVSSPSHPVGAPFTAGMAVSRMLRSARRGFVALDRTAVANLLVSVTLIGAVLTVVAYAPFWAGIQTFTGLGQQVRPLYYNSSIVAFITAPLELIVPPSRYAALDKTVRLVFYLLFALYTSMQVRRLWLQGAPADLRDVLTAAAKITFAALILITFWFQPWYVVWLLPLAALAREPFVRRQGTILAAGALMAYAVSNFLFVAEADLGHDLFVQFFEILVTFAPLLLLRASPYTDGWGSVVRRYAGNLGAALSTRPLFWQRLMLVLVLIVAALLRLLRLGNLFAQVPAGSSEANALKQVSGDLRLFLEDPQGLRGPFRAVQGLLVALFGQTPLAVLLPSALIGMATVLMLYLLTREVLRQGQQRGATTIALLAALLAATSGWHVSLSRSGTEVVALPLLMVTALYWLLLAFRYAAPIAVPQVERPRRSRMRDAPRPARMSVTYRPPDAHLARRSRWLAAGCGICTGLASDLAPGLWVLPLLVAGFFLVWRFRRPEWFSTVRSHLVIVLGTALLTSLPAIWFFARQFIGFAPGSAFLAQATHRTAGLPEVFALPFWQKVLTNLLDVLRLLASQDYSAGYPAVGGTAILPAILGPFFYLGLVLIVIRWRRLSSQALLLLLAMPIVASVAVGAPTGVIEAASVLPATCIVPAVALYEFATFLGHLPIVLDRINGARVFSTPEQIGRVLLLVFLLVSTLRTFYWYFEATLPARPGNQFVPSYTGPPVVRRGQGISYAGDALAAAASPQMEQIRLVHHAV